MKTSKLFGYLKAADEMEYGGAGFYRMASEWVKDEKGKRVLLFLSKEEERHALVVEGLISAFVDEDELPGDVPEPVKPMLFKPRERYLAMVKSADRAEDVVFREAKITEKKSIEYYGSCLKLADDKIMRHAIERLVEEEKSHLEIIKDCENSFKLHGYWTGIERHFALDD